MKMAVYGTLKKGFHNHYLLEDSEFIGTDYVLCSAIAGTGYPIAKFNESSDSFPLKVELYDVTNKEALSRIDRLEGVPTFYNRKNITTMNGVDCIIYEYQGSVNGDTHKGVVDWGNNVVI